MKPPDLRIGRTRALLAITWLITGSGCALASKSDPLSPRYFSPDMGTTIASAPAARAANPTELRLGRITASSYLGERIVFRTQEHELGFYEDRRWTERPDAYLRRALGKKLFEEGGIRRVLAGAGPTLDVELTALEEIRGASPVSRARATVLLHDGRAVLREQTFTIERPIPAGRDGSVTTETSVESMASSMTALVAQIAADVVSNLAALHAPTPAH